MMFADRELVLGSEAARRLGLSRERVRQLAADPRQAFPAPVGRFSTGGDPRGDRIVWDWAEVERWGHAHGHTAAVTAWRDAHASPSSDATPDTLAASRPPTAAPTPQSSRRRSSRQG
jgi:hypothetical protein